MPRAEAKIRDYVLDPEYSAERVTGDYLDCVFFHNDGGMEMVFPNGNYHVSD